MLIFELLRRELNVNVMQWCANYTLQAVILRESLLNLSLRLSPFVSLSNHIRLRTFETTFDEPEVYACFRKTFPQNYRFSKGFFKTMMFIFQMVS